MLLARHCRRATAVDLSFDMLRAVAARARDQGLDNLEAVAAAERLPFADEQFDFLASRFSAHHWRDFAAGLRQARRVLRAGAPAVFIDIFAPAQAIFDTHLQTVEILRDPSHVRDYSLSEWFAALCQAGFATKSCKTWRLRMDFVEWTARMRTPPALAQAILVLQAKADSATRSYFAIEADGSFLIDAVMVEAAAAGANL